jgi:hypothetical protein
MTCSKSDALNYIGRGVRFSAETQLVTLIFLVAFWANQIGKHPVIVRIAIPFADGVHERRNANDRMVMNSLQYKAAPCERGWQLA